MLRRVRWFVLLTALFIALRSGAARADGTETQHSALLSGSVAIPAEKYQFYKLSVDPAVMAEAHLRGHVVASGGTGNDIEVLVIRGSDFLNWQNNHTTHPLFSSGRITATEIDVPLPKAGTYYVVFSNAFSVLTAKTIEGNVDLAWSAPPPTKEEQAAANTAVGAGLTVVIGLLLAAGCVGALIAWIVMSKKKKKKPTA